MRRGDWGTTANRENTNRSPPLFLFPFSCPAVCLANEDAFEKEKGLVLKEYNHAKTAGKLTWKADKVGAYHFVDPDKCGQGMALTVNVEEAAKASRRMMV